MAEIDSKLVSPLPYANNLQLASLFGSLAKCFHEMEKTCQEHAQGKPPKIKPQEAPAAKKSKADLKEEEKLIKKQTK
jgi:hypothetical protein